MTKHKALLETLHKAARGLRDAGLMSAQTMREFDVLCLPKIKEYCPAQIKRMRERTKKPGLAQIGCITRNAARRWWSCLLAATSAHKAGTSNSR